VIDEKAISDGYGILQHDEGVALMPANIDLSGMDVKLVNTMSRESVLRTYVDSVKSKFDYVLIDCPPSLGMLTINSLAAADSVIIPSQPNYLSSKGLDLLMRSISKVKRTINPKLKIDGILFTMVDNRTNNAKEIISSLRSHCILLKSGGCRKSYRHGPRQLCKAIIMATAIYHGQRAITAVTPMQMRLSFLPCRQSIWDGQVMGIRSMYHTFCGTIRLAGCLQEWEMGLL